MQMSSKNEQILEENDIRPGQLRQACKYNVHGVIVSKLIYLVVRPVNERQLPQNSSWLVTTGDCMYSWRAHDIEQDEIILQNN